jgi:hypothetical protein
MIEQTLARRVPRGSREAREARDDGDRMKEGIHERR